MDSFHTFLTDPEDASWVVGDDDEDMPPLVFPTAEAAYSAWQRSQAEGATIHEVHSVTVWLSAPAKITASSCAKCAPSIVPTQLARMEEL